MIAFELRSESLKVVFPSFVRIGGQGTVIDVSYDADVSDLGRIRETLFHDDFFLVFGHFCYCELKINFIYKGSQVALRGQQKFQANDYFRTLKIKDFSDPIFNLSSDSKRKIPQK
jgi:hypothetical protein